MKLLFDFFPVVAFFITFKQYEDPHDGIIAATLVIILATIIQVAISWFLKKRIEKIHLITLILVVLFGGVTLLLNDDLYIKWKPTVINWLFSFVFLGSQFVGKKNLIRRMMDKNIALPTPIWNRLNVIWSLFFLFMGVINLYVVYNFDTEIWVNFKLFGMLGLTFVFVVAQGLFLMKHIKPKHDESGNG